MRAVWGINVRSAMDVIAERRMNHRYFCVTTAECLRVARGGRSWRLHGLSLRDIGFIPLQRRHHRLAGGQPGDIPIYQARKFELSFNLKTAKALGIEIPGFLLARADELTD